MAGKMTYVSCCPVQTTFVLFNILFSSIVSLKSASESLAQKEREGGKKRERDRQKWSFVSLATAISSKGG